MRATLFLFTFSLLFSVTSWALDIVEMAVPGEESEPVNYQGTPSKKDSSFELDLERMNLTNGDTKAREPASIPENVSAKDRRELVLGTISKNYSQLKTCYKQGLNKNTKMEGKVVVGWSMDSQGHVADTEIKSSQLNNKQVEECISSRMNNWQFPAQAVRNSEDRMSYTFSFSADE